MPNLHGICAGLEYKCLETKTIQSIKNKGTRVMEQSNLQDRQLE